MPKQKLSLAVVTIEVSQSIQNLKNEIELLADRTTVVRVYLERPADLKSNLRLTGTLEVSHPDQGQTLEVPSEASLFLRAGGGPGLPTQRGDINETLNFFLKPSDVIAGDVKIKLTALKAALDPDLKIVVRPHSFDRSFAAGPTLRLRALRLRVHDPRSDEWHAPEAAHGLALRSYIERAFPVSRIEWSEVTIDATEGFAPPYSDEAVSIAAPDALWQEKFDLACAHIMAIRARDIDAMTDHRTHYYALVYHPDDFFVGAVSDVPSGARPEVVGVGPAEMEDGSYGAHELGHALGLLHPGFCAGQSREAEDFPEYFEGKISGRRQCEGDSSEEVEARVHYGFDVGDATQRPRALRYDAYYDLMTYCEPVWISAHNYLRTLERLRAEDALEPEKQGDFLHVVGVYCFKGGIEAGELKFVFPIRRPPVTGAPIPKPKKRPAETWWPPRYGTEHRVLVIAKDATGRKLYDDVVVTLKRNDARDLPRDSGAFQVTLPRSGDLRRLELWVDGVLVDEMTGEAAAGPGEVSPGGPSLSCSDLLTILPPRTSPEDPYLLSAAWPDEYERSASHTLQVRHLPHLPLWETIALGFTADTSELVLDYDHHLKRPERGEQSALEPRPEFRLLRAVGFSEQLVCEGPLRVPAPDEEPAPRDPLEVG